MTSTDLGLDLSKYKLGWSDEEDYVFKPKKGLSKDIVEEMSWMKGEPDWMRQYRLKSLEHFEKRGGWIDRGWQRDPQEYLHAGNIWTTCEPEEPILPGVIDVLGDDFIMFASDYPHWDGEWPESTKHLRGRQDIDEKSREKIGGLNALRFYGLN